MGHEELSHGADISWWPLSNSRRLALIAGYNFKTETRYNSDLFNKEILSTMPLFGYSDYFDYFRIEGGFIGGAYALKGYNRSVNARFKYEEHSSIDFKTSYDLLASSFNQRFNPAVQEGTLSSLTISYESGEGAEAWGVIGADNIKLELEQSLTAFGSDWDFTRFSIDIYRRYSTFYQRRFIPNSLDIRINAGTFIGELPVQKNGVLDAALGYFTPFGAFRSKRYVPYEGASYAAIHAEHNFRSTPFELLGIPNGRKKWNKLDSFWWCRPNLDAGYTATVFLK